MFGRIKTAAIDGGVGKAFFWLAEEHGSLELDLWSV